MSCLMLLMLLSACYRKPVYPTMLTEVDSAYVQGDYSLADSLLAAFDEQEDATIRAYHQYLGLTQKFVRAQFTDQDFSLADSLARYYNKRGTRDMHARTLLFLGDIYRLTADNPSALNCFLQAESLGKQTGSLLLQAWACQHIGDTYFDQRMLDECKSYYRRFYQIAEARHDTLRMAHASQRMGLVSTIENNIDSIIFFYKKTIELAKDLPQKDGILPITIANLCDIYIQIEEFDEAAKIMPRDSMNTHNWAYWHLGQNHTDSAICYFYKMLDSSVPAVKADALSNLIDIYEANGMENHSLPYYKTLRHIGDTLKIISQEESIRKVNAQYNFSSIKQERDQQQQKYRQLLSVVIVSLLVLAICLAFGLREVQTWRLKKEGELAHEALLRKEEERKNKESIEAQAKNKQRIEALEQEIAKTNDANSIERKKLEKAIIAAENEIIRLKRDQKEIRLNDLLESQVFKDIKENGTNVDFRLSDEDWKELIHGIDAIYDNFTTRLYALCPMSEIQLRVCCLTKLKLTPAVIANLICRSKQGVSNIRSRLYKKITHDSKSENATELFDAFIEDF